MHVVDALAITGDERRDSLRKALGRWQMTFDPEMSEWGNPAFGSSFSEYIAKRSERGELKYLSNRRKRNQPRFPK